MKVVIVAAGRGSRLEEYGTSKPLVQLSGKPLLQHVIETVVRAFDPDEKTKISVITGWNRCKIEELISRMNRQLSVNIGTVYNGDWEKGNGTSVLAARHVIDEPFLLLMADHIVDPQILQILANTSSEKADLLLAVDYKLTNPMVDLDDVTRVQSNGKYITSIAKHLEPYNCFDTGCFLCAPAFFAALLQAQKQSGGYGISGGVQILAGQLRAHCVDIGQANWIDVDTPEMLEIAQDLVSLS